MQKERKKNAISLSWWAKREGKQWVGRNALDAKSVSICRSTSKLQAVRETAIRLETQEMG